MDSLSKELWFDGRGLNPEQAANILPLVCNYGYNGIMLNPNQNGIMDHWPKNMKLLLYVEQANPGEGMPITQKCGRERDIIVFSKDENILNDENYRVEKRGIYMNVEDAVTLHKAVGLAEKYENILIEFAAQTNIPLELLLALSQETRSKICKKVTSADDGWIAAMVMEMGSYALLLDTDQPDEIINLRIKMDKLTSPSIAMEEMTIQGIKHIGMGDRICVDTTSDLAKDEGMIIGSTSSGGILVSSETHFLPYMELRPFRVNAGALHSYTWCQDNRTQYLSELRAGDEVLIVNHQGESRIATVGRIKMERRPLLLITAVSSGGIEVNAIVQDDWHVRVISKNGEVKNCTQLKNGDVVMGYTCKPGRHVGIAITENIVEK